MPLHGWGHTYTCTQTDKAFVIHQVHACSWHIPDLITNQIIACLKWDEWNIICILIYSCYSSAAYSDLSRSIDNDSVEEERKNILKALRMVS